MVRFVRTLPAALVAAGTACVTPTDKSDTLRIELATIPSLFEGDTLVPDLRLLDADGNALPNGDVALTSSNDLVIRVTPDGALVALDSGLATITAQALRFAQTPVARQDVRVHAPLEVDSVRPLEVQFGATLDVFGTGLNPDKLFAVTLGETALPVASFTPDDPAQPDRFGRLSLWVGPPARTSGGLILLSALGGFVLAETVRVIPFDIYEPNDSTPRALGILDGPLGNPALAFEARSRGDRRVPADWYRFTTTQPGDWTIELGTPAFGRRIAVFVAESAGWDGILWNSGVGLYETLNDSWMVGPLANICQGRLLWFGFGADTAFIPPIQLQGSGATVALRDLPAGTYDVGAVYLGSGIAVWDPSNQRSAFAAIVDRDSVAQAAALPSELRITPGYRSVLPPDAAEENDYCDVATPVTVPGSATGLTIDNPGDVDWYRFTLAAPQALRFTVAADDSTADVDAWIVRNALPDSLVIEDIAAGGGRTDSTAGRLLPAGDYFLIVTDFLGVPTTYSLSASPFPAPPAGAAAVGMSPAALAKLEAYRARVR